MGDSDYKYCCDGKESDDDDRGVTIEAFVLPVVRELGINAEVIGEDDYRTFLRTDEGNANGIRKMVRNLLQKDDRSVNKSSFAVLAESKNNKYIDAFAVANEVNGDEIRVGWVWVSQAYRGEGLGTKIWNTLLEEVERRHPEVTKLIGRFENQSPDGVMRRIATSRGEIHLETLDKGEKPMMRRNIKA